MPIAAELAEITSLKPDVIIVGAGAVGLLMAVTLARRGVQVVVLEAGSRVVEPSSQAVFEGARWRGHALEGLHRGRFRAFGGTTNFWGGQIAPFDPIVFKSRPWASDIGWPLSYEDLLPFYNEVKTTIGLETALDDEAVWARLDINPPTPPPQLDLFLTRWLPEPNFVRLFGAEIERLPNLTVALNAPVTALDLDPDGYTVRAVLVRAAGDETQRLDAPAIVLANGTVEIVRLLKLPLVSGESPPWADNAWLGRGFMDHVDCDVGDVAIIDEKRFRALFDNILIGRIKYSPKLKLSELAQNENHRLSVGGQFMFKSHLNQALADAKIFLRGLLRGRFSGNLVDYLRSITSVLSVAIPMLVRYARHSRISSPADLGVKLRLSAEQACNRENGLILLADLDITGQPAPEVAWTIGQAEIEALRDTALAIADFLKGNGLAEVTLDRALLDADPAFLAGAVDTNHHMGMARMGSGVADGVVDKNLRVFSTANLFVAGAAVFPSAGFANPTFTAMALGARLCRHLVDGRSSAVAQR